MQAITPVTNDQLLSAEQQSLMKVEIFVDPYWVNICDGFSFLLSDCDQTTDWSTTAGGSLSIDTEDKKEGVGSLKNTFAAPVADTAYGTTYNPDGTWDWSAKKHILFDLESDRASTAFTWVKLVIYDTLGNWRSWNLTFSAEEWTAVEKLLSTGDAETVIPPDLTLIDKVRVTFKTADVTPFYEKIDYLRIDDVAAGSTGKNYLESASISLGGAGMTPNPVGGKFNLTLFNEDGIFHPQHPTSPYKDWLKTGRKTRVSVGAIYAGTDRYWQRIIGYMDIPRFSAPGYRVKISGGDYMKLLEDAQFQELDATYPNYWGTSATFNSIASDGLNDTEIYAEGDAMEIGVGEANNVANWVATNCNFVSFADVGGGSTWVGRLTAATGATSRATNANVGNTVAGKEYKIRFKHRGVDETGDQAIRIQIRQASGICVDKMFYPTDDWTSDNVHFIALDTGATEMRIYCPPTIADLRVDEFSIREYTIPDDRYYELPAASKGPYFVTLDGAMVQQGEEDEGWYHVEATRRVFFDRNKTVANGVNNVVIYYFTAAEPEDAVARILWYAGLYANEAAAKAAMDFDDPGFEIDKVWFKAGSTLLSAIRMLCERCNYRFYFKYDGTPVFKAVPAPGAADFTFTSSAHIDSINTYQSYKEIKNRIIIKGIRRAELNTLEEVVQSELTGEDHDDASIAAYGERTLTITNHLFQTQAVIDAMCATLLAERKDPKWYSNLKMPFNPVPLELVDDIQWEDRLSLVLDITETGVVRDIKIDKFSTTYKCEVT